MDKAYILTFTEYEDVFIIGVFSSYEKAKKMKDLLINYPPVPSEKDENDEYAHSIDDVDKYGSIGAELAWWSHNRPNKDYANRFGIGEYDLDKLHPNLRLDNLMYLEQKVMEQENER